MSDQDDTRFDGVFMSVIQQKSGIEGFFECVFGFLRRSTDFYQDQKSAEKVMVGQCSKQFELFEKNKIEKEAKEKERKEKEEQKKKAKEAADLKAKEAAAAKKEDKPTAEVPKVEAPKVEKKPESTEGKTEESKTEEGGEKKEEEDKTPPPLGNGGRNDRYIWTQTLDEVQIYVPIEQNITKRDLIITIESKTMLMQIKG
jgi:hypothetical protein